MIPVVDCEGQIPQEFSNEILEALKSIGFVYLKNIKGFPNVDAEERNINLLADKFWNLDEAVKQTYGMSNDTANDGYCGYVGPSREILNSNSKPEIRESYQIHGPFDKVAFPYKEVPEFQESILAFWKKCRSVCIDVMKALAKALKLKDTEFFTKTHKCIGKEGNKTTLRLLHYPELTDDIEPGTTRLGTHSDYGTITLVIQDNIGGLEVLDREGSWVPATPIPGTILINAGDMLEHWSDGKIVATKHRVMVPKDPALWKLERRSIVFFVIPDEDVVVKPLNGSDKYEPVTVKQYLENMLAKVHVAQA